MMKRTYQIVHEDRQSQQHMKTLVGDPSVALVDDRERALGVIGLELSKLEDHLSKLDQLPVSDEFGGRSPEAVLRTARWCIRKIRQAHQLRNFEMGVVEALLLGMALQELGIRIHPDAVRGRQLKGALTSASRAANAERRAEARLEHVRWQEIADPIWQNDPTKSAANVAMLVQKRLKPNDRGQVPSINTIRQRIKKPDKAG